MGIVSPLIWGGPRIRVTSASQRSTTTANEPPLARRLEAAGWSRIPPSCPWLFLDGGGVPRCSYWPLGERVRTLEAARFTVFNQGFIDEAIASLREHPPDGGAGECSPRLCPSRWNRFLNSLHPSRRPARGEGPASSAPLTLESDAYCACGAPGKPMIRLDGSAQTVCPSCLLRIVAGDTVRDG